jgi:hypothetical protein
MVVAAGCIAYRPYFRSSVPPATWSPDRSAGQIAVEFEPMVLKRPILD